MFPPSPTLLQSPTVQEMLESGAKLGVHRAVEEKITREVCHLEGVGDRAGDKEYLCLGRVHFYTVDKKIHDFRGENENYKRRNYSNEG